MLEGECYVTGSMVVFAVFQIRKAFVTVLECEATLEPVKELTQTLLDLGFTLPISHYPLPMSDLVIWVITW